MLMTTIYILKHFSRQKPGAGRAFDILHEKARSFSGPRLVSKFRNDRSRAPVDVIVHAGAHNIAVVAARGANAIGPGARSRDCVCDRCARIAIGEAVIKIFSLRRPIRRKHPLEAAARRPAGLRIGVGEAAAAASAIVATSRQING